ncbi:Nucleoside diphosphate kinase [Geodia barretti]|nr:Nucleoside diphosphate kinase [Geodia barretti]
MKMLHVTRELAHRHYGAHVDKPFFEGLVQFITSSPLIAIAVEGESAVDVVRQRWARPTLWKQRPAQYVATSA